MKSISVEVEDFDMAKEVKAHSPFSASGAERWEACPGSVALSKGIPDKDSVWSIEGTRAHGVLERILMTAIRQDATRVESVTGEHPRAFPREMLQHGMDAANFILSQYHERQANELLVETKIGLTSIHPEMFGTFDSAIVEHFATLDVFDYKYGAGHAVSPVDNMQMAFYGVALAEKYHWNFKRVRLWIIQPRIRGYDGPVFWEVPTMTLKNQWRPRFVEAVARVENEPGLFVEDTGTGKSWCHWCKAKKICPLKVDRRYEKAKSIFIPLGGTANGKQEESEKESRQEESGEENVYLKTEAQWRKEAREKGKGKRKVGKSPALGAAFKGRDESSGSVGTGDFF